MELSASDLVQTNMQINISVPEIISIILALISLVVALLADWDRISDNFRRLLSGAWGCLGTVLGWIGIAFVVIAVLPFIILLFAVVVDAYSPGFYDEFLGNAPEWFIRIGFWLFATIIWGILFGVFDSVKGKIGLGRAILLSVFWLFIIGLLLIVFVQLEVSLVFAGALVLLIISSVFILVYEQDSNYYLDWSWYIALLIFGVIVIGSIVAKLSE